MPASSRVLETKMVRRICSMPSRFFSLLRIRGWAKSSAADALFSGSTTIQQHLIDQINDKRVETKKSG